MSLSCRLLGVMMRPRVPSLLVSLCVLVVGASHAQSISVDLQASRMVGVAPLAVFFDGTGTTHADVSVRPFHELGFTWDFGDPSAGSWQESGKNKNWATGAVAAHVFELPGSYTTSVTVVDASGSQAQASVMITVLDPANSGWATYHVSQSLGNDANSGLTPPASKWPTEPS